MTNAKPSNAATLSANLDSNNLTKTPTVSVVIPAYNEGELLGRCLESLVNQTVKPFQIIVVDNNSTDNTSAIAKEYGVTLVKEARQGIAWARDAGFDTASGDIIARLDADCIAPEDWIKTITTYYESHPQHQHKAITGVGYFATRHTTIGKIIGTITTIGYNLGNRVTLGSVALFGSCMAFPREWWDIAKTSVCHDSHLVHEDVDLTVHLIKNGYSVAKLDSFYTYMDPRALREPISKTWWRFKIWPRSVYRHRKEPIKTTNYHRL